MKEQFKSLERKEIRLVRRKYDLAMRRDYFFGETISLHRNETFYYEKS